MKIDGRTGLIKELKDNLKDNIFKKLLDTIQKELKLLKSKLLISLLLQSD